MAVQTQADQLLTVKDVIRRTALGRTTVLALLRSRQLPSVHIGRSVRVTEQALAEWIESLK